ncbi:MAG TPA: SHD1 domain-containing protein [Pirellulaceae bacterium]|nr:SHD1 domain-containing protein [Pirellulaceae bacterium]
MSRFLPWRRLRVVVWTLGLLVSLVAASRLPAAETYKVDDAVEIFFLNRVQPATVVGIDKRGLVVVEFEFAGGLQQRTYKPAEIRRALEPGTLSHERLWTDATGKFKLKAKLLAIDDVNVTLRKTDKSEVTLEIAKLSNPDKKLVAEIAKATEIRADAGPGRPAFPTPSPLPGGEATAAAPAPPELTEFALDSAADAGTENLTGPVALTPDPRPNYLTLAAGGASVKAELFDEVTSLVSAGGNDGWVIATIVNAHPQHPGATRAVWCSLTKKKIETQQLLPAGESALDYHAPSRRLLTFSQRRASAAPLGVPVLTIWEVGPKDKEAKAVVSWQPLKEARHPLRDPWCRLIHANLVVTALGDQHLTAWDVEKKQVRYRVKLGGAGFSGEAPVLSGGRKYVLLPNDHRACIYEAETGKLVSVLPAENFISAVGISGDGQQAVVHWHRGFAIWDLTDATAKPRQFQSPVGLAKSIGLLSDDRVLIGTNHQLCLYNLSKDLPIWSYDLIGSPRGPHVADVVGTCFPYTALEHQSGGKMLCIGAVDLPGEAAEAAETAANRENLLVVKPGTAVRVNVATGEFNARTKEALEKKAVANGWRLTPDAAIVITAEMKRGEATTRKYQAALGGATTDVTITPAISEVTIKDGEKLLWQSGTQTHVSSFFLLAQGQSLQQAVDQQQNANPGFFEHVLIPKEILDPKWSGGFGSSLLTARGLEKKGGP